MMHVSSTSKLLNQPSRAVGNNSAVIAYSDGISRFNINKHRHVRTFRKRTPTQHDVFLQFASKEDIDFCLTDDVQANFDVMYQYMHEMLNRFYPEHQITITTSDPHFVTSVYAQAEKSSNVFWQS